MKNSCNIGFVLTNEHSCFNAAFGLAYALQERGHNAVFFVDGERIFSQSVESHGFKAAKFTSTVEAHTTSTKRPIVFRLWKRLMRRGQAATPNHNGLVDSLKRNSIDLCLFDTMRNDTYPTLTALVEMGLATILLSYTFASRFQTRYPPVFASTRPRDGRHPTIAFRIICALLWSWAIATPGRAHAYDTIGYLKRWFQKLFYQIPDPRWERRLRRLGRRSIWSEWKRRPLMPEIVFGHRTLDWPAIASSPGRFYFGVTDLFRKEATFDWSMFESNRPIAYCNISTVEIGSKKGDRVAKRYFDVVIDAFSQHKDWQLILACGPYYESLRRSTVAPNIQLFARVPQLAVLEKADLVISWGGAGTIRECVNFGVPMLVFPMWTDQFGNAARVLYRKLGICADILHVTPSQMVEMVDRLFTDETIRSAAIEMQMQLSKQGEMEDLVDFVKHHTSLNL